MATSPNMILAMLPNEVLHLVFGFADRISLLALKQTCKQFEALVRPYLWCRFIYVDGMEDCENMVAAMDKIADKNDFHKVEEVRVVLGVEEKHEHNDQAHCKADEDGILLTDRFQDSLGGLIRGLSRIDELFTGEPTVVGRRMKTTPALRERSDVRVPGSLTRPRNPAGYTLRIVRARPLENTTYHRDFGSSLYIDPITFELVFQDDPELCPTVEHHHGMLEWARVVRQHKVRPKIRNYARGVTELIWEGWDCLEDLGPEALGKIANRLPDLKVIRANMMTRHQWDVGCDIIRSRLIFLLLAYLDKALPVEEIHIHIPAFSIRDEGREVPFSNHLSRFRFPTQAWFTLGKLQNLRVLNLTGAHDCYATFCMLMQPFDKMSPGYESDSGDDERTADAKRRSRPRLFPKLEILRLEIRPYDGHEKDWIFQYTPHDPFDLIGTRSDPEDRIFRPIDQRYVMNFPRPGIDWDYHLPWHPPGPQTYTQYYRKCYKFLSTNIIKSFVHRYRRTPKTSVIEAITIRVVNAVTACHALQKLTVAAYDRFQEVDVVRLGLNDSEPRPFDREFSFTWERRALRDNGTFGPLVTFTLGEYRDRWRASQRIENAWMDVSPGVLFAYVAYEGDPVYIPRGEDPPPIPRSRPRRNRMYPTTDGRPFPRMY
ncbi:hypothetical protein QBC35DRAFT_150885 [Podospora australis]|uniref:F-box domain-containing protein n=1 Tax=Podospora australis TaxID=1536484 RepID=A0AAN7AE34_9PEZI|nr:hypothetical protein QBC35DRAFT_150885 [Podospora australis]